MSRVTSKPLRSRTRTKFKGEQDASNQWTHSNRRWIPFRLHTSRTLLLCCRLEKLETTLLVSFDAPATPQCQAPEQAAPRTPAVDGRGEMEMVSSLR